MIARAVLIRPEEIDVLDIRNRKCPPLYLLSRNFATIGLKFANYYLENTFLITVCRDQGSAVTDIVFLLYKTTIPPVCKVVVDYPLEAVNRSSPIWMRNRVRLDAYLGLICDDKSSVKRHSGVVRLRPTLVRNPISPSELTPEMAWITQTVQLFADELMTRPCSQRYLYPFSLNGIIDTAAGLWQQDQALKRTKEAKTQSNSGHLIVDPGEISFQRWKSNLDMEKHAAHMRRLRTFE